MLYRDIVDLSIQCYKAITTNVSGCWTIGAFITGFMTQGSILYVHEIGYFKDIKYTCNVNDIIFTSHKIICSPNKSGDIYIWHIAYIEFTVYSMCRQELDSRLGYWS